MLVTQTRVITGSYYLSGSRPRPVFVTLQHFNFDEGFEVPLLDGIMGGADTAQRHLMKLSSSMATFIVFVCTKTPDRGTRLLRRRNRDVPWQGDMLILRRAMFKQGYVNLTKRDKRHIPYIISQYVSLWWCAPTFSVLIQAKQHSRPDPPAQQRGSLPIIGTLRKLATGLGRL